MQIKKIFDLALLIILGLSTMVSSLAWGETSAASIGDVAGNIFNVGMTVREIVRVVCIVAGTGLILASLLQYKKHRQNPVETTWGTVIFTFVTGVAIICLSFIPIDV